MYVKFPKDRWPEIEKAEKDDKESQKIFENLSAEYLEKYMPEPNADPHGGIEDFIEQEKQNSQCIPVPRVKNGFSKIINEDEMM